MVVTLRVLVGFTGTPVSLVDFVKAPTIAPFWDRTAIAVTPWRAGQVPVDMLV